MNRHKRERLRILKELDVEAALKISPDAAKVVVGGYNASGRYTDRQETALAALHRARMASPQHFNEAERGASRQWLYDRGWLVDMRGAL